MASEHSIRQGVFPAGSVVLLRELVSQLQRFREIMDDAGVCDSDKRLIPYALWVWCGAADKALKRLEQFSESVE